MTAEKTLFREAGCEVFTKLKASGKDAIDLSYHYVLPGLCYGDIYAKMTDRIIREAKINGHICYAIPGALFVFEKTVKMVKSLARENGISVKTRQGLSFLDTVYLELEIDPETGLQIVNASRIIHQKTTLSSDLGCLVGQLGARQSLDHGAGVSTNSYEVQKILQKFYPEDLAVSLIFARPSQLDVTEIDHCRLGDLAATVEQLGVPATAYLKPVIDVRP